MVKKNRCQLKNKLKHWIGFIPKTKMFSHVAISPVEVGLLSLIFHLPTSQIWTEMEISSIFLLQLMITSSWVLPEWALLCSFEVPIHFPSMIGSRLKGIVFNFRTGWKVFGVLRTILLLGLFNFLHFLKLLSCLSLEGLVVYRISDNFQLIDSGNWVHCKVLKCGYWLFSSRVHISLFSNNPYFFVFLLKVFIQELSTNPCLWSNALWCEA